MKNESTAKRIQGHTQKAFISAKDYGWLTLGDLRKLVDAAEGITDEAEVRIEDVTRHYIVAENWMARRIEVFEEILTSD